MALLCKGLEGVTSKANAGKITEVIRWEENEGLDKRHFGKSSESKSNDC